METKREYQKIRRHSPVTAESVCEYTLPDYNPDVRKLVHTAARIIQGTRFTDGERTELPVTVVYDVIYLDGEGCLNHTDFTSEAELVCTLPEGVGDSWMQPELLGYSVRLTGPRRFSARATLSARLKTKETASIDIEGDAFTAGEPEVAEVSASVMCESWGECEGDINEEIWEREGAILDEVKILHTEALGRVDSVKITDGVAEVRGEIKIGLLVSSGGECPEYIEKHIPVSESIALDSDGICQGEIKIKEITPTLRPDEGGISIAVSLKYLISAWCVANAPLTLIKDCYMKERGVRNEYTEVKYEELIASTAYTLRLTEEFPREGILSADTRNLVYTRGCARIEETEVSESSVRVDGKMRISGVACEVFADGAMSYSGVKLDVPYSANVNLDSHLPEGATAEVRPYVTDLSVTVDSDMIYINAEICHLITVFKERRVSCIGVSMLTDEITSRDPSVITVYYPEAGESLFEVAKRHHASVLTVASDNSLSDTCLADPSSESSLVGVKKLIIR